MGNHLQARHIQRYHHHLPRLGRAESIEHTCRLWITRFAALWRDHQHTRCVTARDSRAIGG